MINGDHQQVALQYRFQKTQYLTASAKEEYDMVNIVRGETFEQKSSAKVFSPTFFFACQSANHFDRITDIAISAGNMAPLNAASEHALHC